eukprot:CAMPEP_0195534682 /NCGR_PEP_ID=MMETSP0794_2-20130614/42829_1 /TAXON_ID=515487 /ORGANISM="Stephanopyxis turris, Strain CCMP 815" /LENGTH=86 /DNA_ID=CAMNT_0040667591 /DNA_START=55 /DNA_END=312 /DNA_ORIENTATION=-
MAAVVGLVIAVVLGFFARRLARSYADAREHGGFSWLLLLIREEASVCERVCRRVDTPVLDWGGGATDAWVSIMMHSSLSSSSSSSS